MTVLSRASLKALWVARFQPTSANFSDLFDSVTERSSLLDQMVTAAATARGIFRVNASGAGAYVSAGATGLTLLATENATAALTAMGATPIGIKMVQAADVTAAVTAAGASAIGMKVFFAADTTAATTAMGAGAFGIQMFKAATTADGSALVNVVTYGGTAQLTYIGAATAISVSHGLAQMPNLVNSYLECITSAHGYAVGTRIPLPGAYTNTNPINSYTISYDATTIRIRMTGGAIIVADAANNSQSIVATEWRIVAAPMRIG